MRSASNKEAAVPVYLLKIEHEGTKDLDDGREKTLFESRNALFDAAGRDDQDFIDCRQRLRDEVDAALGERGCSHIGSGGGASIEISKERLLELAEHARTRNEIAAEREPLETV